MVESALLAMLIVGIAICVVMMLMINWMVYRDKVKVVRDIADAHEWVPGTHEAIEKEKLLNVRIDVFSEYTIVEEGEIV